MAIASSASAEVLTDLLASGAKRANVTRWLVQCQSTAAELAASAPGAGTVAAKLDGLVSIAPAAQPVPFFFDGEEDEAAVAAAAAAAKPSTGAANKGGKGGDAKKQGAPAGGAAGGELTEEQKKAAAEKRAKAKAEKAAKKAKQPKAKHQAAPAAELNIQHWTFELERSSRLGITRRPKSCTARKWTSEKTSLGKLLPG